MLGIAAGVIVVSVAADAVTPRREARGQLRLAFEEHSPLSDLPEVHRRLHDGDGTPPLSDQQLANGRFELKSFPLDVLVPTSYKPDGTWGLFVWVGVAQPPPQWVGVLTRRKVILVESRAGKSKVHSIYVRLPLDYVHNLKKLYTLDERRVYVGGFSAGGHIAQWCQTKFPDVFGGVMLVAGGSLITTAQVDGEAVPTVLWSHRWYGRTLDDVKRSIPLVIIAGANDHADLHRARYDGMILDGYARAAYFEVPGLGHRLPDAPWFERAIKALDDPAQKRAALTTAPTDGPLGPDQLAQARRLFATGQYYLDAAETEPDRVRRARNAAGGYFKRVMDEYPKSPYAQRASDALGELDAKRESPTTPERPPG
jgi:hypothetical protein